MLTRLILPASSSEPGSFGLLHPQIQRWIWQQGWTELRDIQDQAIPAVLSGTQDVILAAATAMGKTEAAFLPILSRLLALPEPGVVFYISPLKALINDQWRRLNDLCEQLEIPVIAWHGESNATRKQRFLKQPAGIVLITPESLEALFVNRGSAMPTVCANLNYLVIDELHAFIGSERGQQLQSLLHRLELAATHPVPRIGLSATLGDMSLAATFLRPRQGSQVTVIQARNSQQEIKILLKGYTDNFTPPADDDGERPPSDSQLAIGQHLYQVMRDGNNLIFPNSRSLVENYAAQLRRYCQQDHIANVFWPHHGSLSRELREDSERALKDDTRPATIICTTTLELGIDVGAVKAVAQIDAPPSVASLRQRLGRSGRRQGEAAILRAYNIEARLTPQSGFSDCLREGLLHSIAMIRLLLAGWVEPPARTAVYASTLVQQILSVIAEKGGIQTAQLWRNLIATGPFTHINRDDFLALLSYLGKQDVLMQDSSGLLLAGSKGERLLNHYHFYTAFSTDEEFRIEHNGKVLGSLPFSQPLLPNQALIFAGRSWRVLTVDTEARRISVKPARGGTPPVFESRGLRVHDRVRQEIYAVLAGQEPVLFLDAGAQQLLQQARDYFQAAHLQKQWLLASGNSTLLLTWRGDTINNTLALLLAWCGLEAVATGATVVINGSTPEQVQAAIADLLAHGAPSLDDLLAKAGNLRLEKWDWALPVSLLHKSYAASCLDMDGAMAWLQGQTHEQHEGSTSTSYT